jgi:hypothetical protein
MLGRKALLGFRPGQRPLGLHEVDPWSNSYPPISLFGRLMEIIMCYGEWIKISEHVDLYTGTRRCLFFFFFFDGYIWAGKFLNSRQKDFETLGWPEETSVI